MAEDAKQFTTCAKKMSKTGWQHKEFDMVRSTIFKFHSVRSVIITKLKTISSQRTDTCIYKIHR